MDLKLEEIEKLAQEKIKKELKNSENPFLLFDGRSGSLVILHLLRQINMGKVPALFIDTTVEFKEIYQFIEKMRKLWGFRSIIERNENALKTIKIAEDREKCCSLLKIEALENAIKKHNIDRLFVFMDDKIKAELFIKDGIDILVYPIQHFSSEDIRNYILKYNLPHCSLYDKGYYNILCVPCTNAEKFEKKQKSKQDEDEIKKRLKALGYI